VEAFIPTQALAPAHIGHAGPPAGPPALGIPGRPPGAVEGFLGPALSSQELDERQKKRHQGRGLLAELPLALLPGGPRRKGGPEMALRRAIKAPLTAKALPLPDQGQGHHRTPAQGGLGARVELGGKEVLQKSSAITYRIVRKVSTSTIEVLLFLGKIELFYRLGAPSV
jgi:hypothetical protein